MKRWLTLWLAMLWLLAGAAQAQDYMQTMNTPFPIPDQYQLVNDYSGRLRIARAAALEQRLQALERRNGTQIVFLSVPNTGKDDARTYAEAVFKKWDIGNHGQGNGILFFVGATQAHILVGPGIAGAVPDVLLARIQRKLLAPVAYDDDAVGEGIEQVLDALIKASNNEQTFPAGNTAQKELIADTMPAQQRHLIALLCMAAFAYAAWLVWRRVQASRGAPRP